MSAKIRADRMMRNRDRISEAMAMITDARAKEIERRAALVPGLDGFAVGGSISIHGSEVARPTEDVVIAAFAGYRDKDDPQAVAFRIIDTELRAMAKSALNVERQWRLIQHITDGRRGRESTLGSCNACLRSDVPNVGSDRIKSGYCPACYTEWRRQECPDRPVFELTRRELEEA